MSAGFDLDKYLKASRRVPTDDLAWDEVTAHPLMEGEVRFLRYMMNIEAHTIVYLKELLSTRAIEETEVTSFLSCWAYEEFFHGVALERFLSLYVGARNVRNEAADRLRQGSALGRALKRIATPVLSAASPDFTAVHMAWGATQEITTLHGYESLARQSRHPVLKELMARIVRDERRHFAFYQHQAAHRLDASPFMRRETRFFMDRLWRPVGVGTMPQRESDFTSWYLFHDGEGQEAVRAVEDAVARLPGMAGWRGLSKAVSKSIQRAERAEPGLASWAYRTAAPAAA